jgi:hypothetical protein
MMRITRGGRRGLPVSLGFLRRLASASGWSKGSPPEIVKPSAVDIHGAIASSTSLTSARPRPRTQVSTEMQPGHRIEQPCTHIPTRRPGPSLVTGK